MAVSNISSRYKLPFNTVINLLTEGLRHLSKFVKDLKVGFEESKNDLDYIEETLYPSVEMATHNFKEMMKIAEKLLDEINRAFEGCISELKQLDDTLSGMDIDLARLIEELRRTEQAVSDFEEDCHRKNKELDKAKDALNTAEKKLREAKEVKKATIVGGYGTMVGSLVATFVFPPAAVGVVVGAAAEIAGLTVFEDARKQSANRVDSAQGEVRSSTEALSKANKKKDEIKNRLSNININKDRKEDEKRRKQNDQEAIKSDRKCIIELNENFKRCYTELSIFNGTFQVLRCESEEGYSLSCLKSPITELCKSLHTLLYSPALEYVFEKPALNLMKLSINDIQAVQLPAIRSTNNDIDGLI